MLGILERHKLLIGSHHDICHSRVRSRLHERHRQAGIVDFSLVLIHRACLIELRLCLDVDERGLLQILRRFVFLVAA